MRLYLLKLAFMHRPDIAATDIPVPGYVVQTDDGANILIDAGFPYQCIENPQLFAPPGLFVEMRKEDFILNRLNAIGLRPDDIDILVCTHFDPDHASNHDSFTNAELVVQREHYEFVCRTEHERFACESIAPMNGNFHFHSPKFFKRAARNESTPRAPKSPSTRGEQTRAQAKPPIPER